MVLSIPEFIAALGPQAARRDFTNTVRTCLATAQQKQKKRLIIDLRGNLGGVVLLAYDLFKQLFPPKTPAGLTNFRAFPLFDDVGQMVTHEYDSVSAFDLTPADFNSGYVSIFNGDTNLDAHLDDYSNWADFYGPVQAYGANFTNIARYNLSDLYQRGDTLVSGYGNQTNATPVQVFAADDIILLQDGICASTCAVFSEFMKSQAHVKSVVMGGRAQPGPMAAVGGVKGANVYSAIYLRSLVTEAYKSASPARQAEFEDKYAEDMANFPHAIRRVAADPTTGSLFARVNIRNNIRQGDGSLTPLQFVSEAADCRLFYQPRMILEQDLVWKAAYNAIWGDGTCVEGSTGQESSKPGVAYFPNGGAASEDAGDAPESGGEPETQRPGNAAMKAAGGGAWAVAAAMALSLVVVF